MTQNVYFSFFLRSFTIAQTELRDAWNEEIEYDQAVNA